jgi:vanillate O-demethylase monooxygenase subunit
MHEQLFAAFYEDVEGLGALEVVLDDVDEATYEISVASDAPAVSMRIHL